MKTKLEVEIGNERTENGKQYYDFEVKLNGSTVAQGKHVRLLNDEDPTKKAFEMYENYCRRIKKHILG